MTQTWVAKPKVTYCITFPATSNYGKNPDDGFGGPPVADKLMMYVAELDDYDGRVIHKESLANIIDDLITDHRTYFGNGEEIARGGRTVLRKFSKALVAASKKIDLALSKKDKEKRI